MDVTLDIDVNGISQLRVPTLTPARAQAALESFLARGVEAKSGVPDAKAYEFQSGVMNAMFE